MSEVGSRKSEVGIHHPSCTPNDRDLVWFCNQCGLKESAEGSEQEWTVKFDNMIYAGEQFVTLIPDRENRERVVSMHNAALAEVKQ